MTKTESKTQREPVTKMAYFRTDEDTWERLSILARLYDVTVSHIIRRAVREYLKAKR